MTQLQHGVEPRDWVTIWQSEWAAMAVDREALEGLAAAALAWNAAFAPRADGQPPGRAGADAAAGAAPAGAAPGAGKPAAG